MAIEAPGPVPRPIEPARYPARRTSIGARLLPMLRTSDPKDIAVLYLVTSFGFFLVGGAMALLMRAELARPWQQLLSTEQYNHLFTTMASPCCCADRPTSGGSPTCRSRTPRTPRAPGPTC